MEAGPLQARCSRLGTGTGKSGLTAAQPREPQERVLCTGSTSCSLTPSNCTGLSYEDCVNEQLKCPTTRSSVSVTLTAILFLIYPRTYAARIGSLKQT